jgi:glycosyltransferase involved in cell wall biosynthesis
LLTDKVNALILDDPKDAAVLTQLLQSILDNSTLREKLSAESLKFADNYTWARIAQEQEQIYLKTTNFAV